MARRRKPIALREHARLHPPETDHVLVTVSVGPFGEAIALWSSASGREALTARVTEPSGASFPVTTSAHGVRARVVAYAPEPGLDLTVGDLRLAHCHVQPLPGGRVLFVAARCRLGADGAEANAMIVTAEGQVERTGVLGDGIEHVQTTPAGKIWVGYFDEGVYGGNGWHVGSVEPLGAAGMVRFSSRLRPEWRFANGPDPIEECYALNLSGETAWSTYYSRFPIVRVDGDTVTSWPGTGSAAQALIVDGTRCALLGGYAADRDRLLAGDLTRGHFRAYQLILPGNRRLPSNAWVIGRGPHLHVFADTTWYRLDLDDLR
ncbi:hypothetical protein AB0H43_17260 [Hamadaea sp. NPDC050747]|uniref:hypothetical protein n=1 Tax=Hamadaea sp. NPDC050747 TaxID=3155789 RepID=UPI0033E8F520